MNENIFNNLINVTSENPQIQEILDAMDDLINSDGGVELPGLDLDTIAENFVEVKYGDTLSKLPNKEEAESLKEKWTSYYKDGEGRLALQMEINTIKSSFVAARDQLTYIGEAAASAVASNAVPAVITVGSATSTANPAYALIENKTKMNQLLSMTKNVEANLVTLLKSSAQIAFPIPSSVTSLIETLSTVKQTVNAIPV
jgi:hypothetical protein